MVETVGRLIGVILLITVPLFLVTSNVRWAVNSPHLYNVGFARYDIANATGIPIDRLQIIGGQIRDYFNNDIEYVDPQVDGHSLFGQREVLHMKDVKNLVRGVYMAQQLSIVGIVACFMALLTWRKRDGLRAFLRFCRLAGTLTAVVILGLGIASFVAWHQVFLVFHQISFSNLLWVLDPQKDYLIRMFPSGFFLMATLLIATATLAQSVILGTITTVGLRYLNLRSLL